MKIENWYHWAFKVKDGTEGWTERADFEWLWRELKKIFPEAAARCVMSNHGHALAQTLDLAGTARRISSLQKRMNGFRKKGGRSAIVWDPVSAPSPVSNVEKWLRDIRYIHLNPVRARLVSDPLAWPWSTHRDWVGAGTDPCPEWLRQWSELLPWSGPGWEREFHRYVSADPSTGHPEGTVGVPSAQSLLTELKVCPSGIGVLDLAKAWGAAHRVPAPQILRRKGKLRKRFMIEATRVWALPTGNLARWANVTANYVSVLRRTEASEAEKNRARLRLAPFLLDPRLRK